MARTKTKVIKELEPEDIAGYTPARIEHYYNLGYRPYLMENGKIKWLTPAQRSMRAAKVRKPKLRTNLFGRPRNITRKKRRRRSYFRSFFREHWLSLLITAILIAAAILLYLYANKIL
ncbi:MAG: hypothetical protein PHC50_05400 [Candidatus Cloacimonetes bacterium]|nr:hypothetical protein [Candidatus Cloacimonadota bacterium]